MKSCYSLLFIVISVCFSCSPKQNFKVLSLKTSHIDRPLGLEERPVFSWQIRALAGFKQRAYQLLLASHPDKLEPGKADIWDSGKVSSSQSQGVNYPGKMPEDGQRVYWRVIVWDQDNQPASSKGTWFEMGLTQSSSWKSSWISSVPEVDTVPPLLPAPYFRKTFQITEEIQQARLYISGLGYHQVHLNGKKVGDHELDPALTRYDKRVKYVVHDVTDMLMPGDNAIGIVLGNGWYNQHTREAWDFDKAPWRASPAVKAQLMIVDQQGKEQLIKTDATWKVTQSGPIIFDGVHNGETYDARKELGNWSEAAYEDESWQAAIPIEGPQGKLSAQVMPPIRVTDKLEPKTSWDVNDSTVMLDFGQNLTGWANIRVKGPAGSRVKMRYGERIYPDSTLDVEELSRFIWTGDTQTDRYYLKGEGEESWHPFFTYQGFQYLEVTISDPEVELLDIQADVVHTDLTERGYFRSSNDMFNQLQDNFRWSFLGNYHGYPTDCPHREKMGWTGDALLVAETGLYNFDLTRAYLKWLDDFVDEQRETGDLPGIIPTSGWGYTYNQSEDPERGYGPQWEGAFLEVPWQVFRFTGDTSIMQKYYPALKKYVNYLESNANGYLLNFGIDDHKQLENKTQGPFLASAFFYYFSDMLSGMAEVLGNETDSSTYMQLAESIREAFHHRYYDTETGTYDHGGQTSQAIPLFTGMVSSSEEERVLAGLLDVIELKKGHIDAGVVGTKAVLQVLMKFGEDEVLYGMVNKRSFPGWGYWVDELGANTLFQNWDGSQSRNHIMFGTVVDYFFKGLAGIRPLEAYPGFERFLIQPLTDNELEWVEAGHESPYGMIRSHWKKQGKRISLELEVPANSEAEVRLPEGVGSDLLLNGKQVPAADLIRNTDRSGPYARLLVGSGRHVLEF
ncbi:family 78 glycoside hydrolase catalytic domain [Cyclobacterium jeungdonense]|uniref:alpha-L-rhamnosidase n=1 Tax=Cyclobacterium jeungdonense TaxID=708087 RepID=A0ABT8C1K4_9BACT|nr:family 78 glycoside hydrolase catalytic domain [Cyclobacterium jeungdonense]MDN3686226.1 family 78 glycoside hydrolase catalytic domain [Cyclobacterium jeungdonense]